MHICLHPDAHRNYIDPFLFSHKMEENMDTDVPYVTEKNGHKCHVCMIQLGRGSVNGPSTETELRPLCAMTLYVVYR